MRGEAIAANSLLSPMHSAGSTMRGTNRRGGRPMWKQNLAAVELGRCTRLASWMTALWVATVLTHSPRLGSQFWQGCCALAHGQLHSEHNDKIEQGQQGSLHGGAVFCPLPLPVAQEAVLEDHLGGTVAGVLETRFAWAWRLAAAIAKLKAAGGCCPSSLWFV
jgi:hypothetical protein